MRVFNSHTIYVKPERWVSVAKQIKQNLQDVIPRKLIEEMSDKHLKVSQRTITHSYISSQAQGALIGELKYSDTGKTVIKINSNSYVSGIFEKGVKKHLVRSTMLSDTGRPVLEWLDKHGFAKNQAFFVGGEDSTLRRPGLRFMEKGFEECWKGISKKVDLYLNTKI